MVKQFIFGLLLATAVISTAEECSPGKSKQEDCNTCVCTETGLWICTKIGCNVKREVIGSPGDQCTEGDTTSFDNCNTCTCMNVAQLEPQCTDGKTSSDGCNTCICGNGNWACTLKLCLDEPQSVDKRSVVEEEPPCTDGDTTSFDGCNSCICGNGNWACTLKLCFEQGVVKREVAAECSPGDSKLEDCNQCVCTETGIWICTKIGCNKKREAIAAGFQAK